MSKDEFVQVLKSKGYGGAHLDEKGCVTVEVVDDNVKNTYINVKLIAQKVGFHHTIRVKKLEESNG